MEKLKALIISDNHGVINSVESLVKGSDADTIFHCGDWCESVDSLPKGIQLVRGNCDFDNRIPVELITSWGAHRLLMVHGDRYQVKSSLLALKYKAEEAGANLILFGHSHHPLSIQDGDKVFINPGSVTQPRGYPRPTYAIMEWEQIDDTKGMLYVSFYSSSGEKQDSLSNSFCIHLPRKTS